MISSGKTIDGRRWRLPDRTARPVRVEHSPPESPVGCLLPEPEPKRSDRLPVISRERMERLSVLAWARSWVTRQGNASTRERRPSVAFSAEVTAEHLCGVWWLQNGMCALSGRAMTIPQRVDVGAGFTGAQIHSCNVSVDRIDSAVGYECGNIQLVCCAVNSMKSNMPDAEFVEWCRDVARNSQTP